MKDNIIFRYKNGRIIPIKVDNSTTTNDYMNNKIRNNKKIIAYHSSPKDFDQFDERFINPNDPDFPINGFYFTDDQEGASPYDNSNVVYKVELNLNKMATDKDLKDVLIDIKKRYGGYDDSQIPSRSRSWEDEVRLRLKDKGFDGMQTRGVNYNEAKQVLKEHNVYNYKTKMGWDRKLAKENGGYTYYEGNTPIYTYETLEDWKKDNPNEYVVFDKNKIKIVEKKRK